MTNQGVVPMIQCVPLATEPGISLIILPLMRIFQRLQTHTTDTFLFISRTTNVLLFKFRCNLFIGVRIVKEMPGSAASGTHCICYKLGALSWGWPFNVIYSFSEYLGNPFCNFVIFSTAGLLWWLHFETNYALCGGGFYSDLLWIPYIRETLPYNLMCIGPCIVVITEE